MATAVEHRSQSHLGGLGYDPLRYTQPQFTNPWGAPHVASHAQLYQQPLQSTVPQRASPMTGHYSPASQHSMAHDMLHPQARSPYGAEYAPQPAQPSFLPTSAPRYSPEHFQQVGSYAAYEQDRRPSYHMKAPQPSARDTFNDALDSARGMVAMSQDITPRNIYAPRNGSHDSYGFPTGHSSTSSISSASGYPYHYASSYQGSVDGSSVTDYSSASEDAMASRTLPAPGSMMSGFPPEPSSMMTQFNSKMSPSAQKKHKCKICDKRFTRPSSLQTHMYSHTGEKPFACDFDGCGRHFSVVSNLRRHKKCHKAGGSDNGSVEDDS